MKTLSKVLLSVLTLAVGSAVPFTLSAQQPAPERPVRPERQGSGPGMGGNRLEMMSERLGLTAEQKTRLRPIIEAEQAAMLALRDDTSLTPEARRDKMREQRESFAAQIRGVLTPDQQAKLAELRGPGGRGGPGAQGGPGGQPRPRQGGEPKSRGEPRNK